MSETARDTAQRVVTKLLDSDDIQEYASDEQFQQRPGGPRDPYRQSTGPAFAGKRPSFAGKRTPATTPGAPGAPGTAGPMKKPSRFGLRFPQESAQMEDGSSETPGKAWHQGKIPSKTSGTGRSGNSATKSWHQGTGPGDKKSSQGAKSSEGNAAKAWNQGKGPGEKTSSQGAHSAMGTPAKAWHQGKIPHKTSSQGATISMGNPTKAWHTGLANGAGSPSSGIVSRKPGTVAPLSKGISYREALIRRVNEKLAAKKAMKMGKAGKGKVVAKPPGKVCHEGLEEAKLKGVNAKKMLNTIAKKPGKVSRSR